MNVGQSVRINAGNANKKLAIASQSVKAAMSVRKKEVVKNVSLYAKIVGNVSRKAVLKNPYAANARNVNKK